MMLLEFTLATVTSCTTAHLRISGQDTATIMDTEFVCFQQMLSDMYTMELHTTATTIYGTVLTVDIM